MGLLLRIKDAILASTATKIATAAAVIVVAAGGTAGLAYADVFTTPEKAVENASVALAEAEPGASEEIFGLNSLFKAIQKKGAEVGFEATVEDISMEEFGLGYMTLPNASFKMVGRTNTAMASDVSVDMKVADTTILSGNVYVDAEQVMVALPQLFSKQLYINYADEQFAEKFKNSALVEMAGYTKEQLDELLLGLTDPVNYASMMEDYGKLMEELQILYTEKFENVETEKAEKEEITVNGETVVCKVYTADIPKETAAELVREYADVLKAYISGLASDYGMTEEDMAGTYEEMDALVETICTEIDGINLTSHVYNKRMVRQKLSWVRGTETGYVEVTYAVKGNPFENMDVAMLIPVPEEEASKINFRVATENNDDRYAVTWTLEAGEENAVMQFSYEKLAGDFVLDIKIADAGLRLTGAFGELEKGKKIGIELDKIVVTEGEESKEIALNVKTYLKVLEEEILMPEGEKTELLNMTTEELEAWSQEISTNAYNMVMKLMRYFE